MSRDHIAAAAREAAEAGFDILIACAFSYEATCAELKTTLKAEINKEAWDTLYSEVSWVFEKPSSGRIAVKVINHLGDEVTKIFDVK